MIFAGIPSHLRETPASSDPELEVMELFRRKAFHRNVARLR